MSVPAVTSLPPAVDRPRPATAAALKRRPTPMRDRGMMRAVLRCPWPIWLFVAGLLVPPSASFYVASLRLSVYRVVLLVAIIPCATWLVRARGRLVVTDWLVVGFVAWSSLAIAVHSGALESVESIGVFVVETLGAYLLTRRFVTTYDRWLGFAALYVLVVIALAFVTVPESITGVHLVQQLSMDTTFVSNIETRFGFHRAYGPFQHPVLYGAFAAGALGIAWSAFRPRRGAWLGRTARTLGVIVAAAASISSGAMAGMSTQIIIIGWSVVSRRMRSRWWVFAGLLSAFYVTADVLSNRSGIRMLLSYLTFSPGSAHGRLMIWHFGVAAVAQRPLFGVGFGSWEHPSWMTDSIDNYWLANAVQFGLPAALLSLGALIWTLVAMHRRPALSEGVARARVAMTISLLGLGVVGATAYFWNQLLVWFFAMLGASVWLLKDTRSMRRNSGLRRGG